MKKGGADYIVDKLAENFFVYKLELKLNEYSEYQKNKSLVRFSISYKKKK